MARLNADQAPGSLRLTWKKRVLTAPGGGILRLYRREGSIQSDEAHWQKQGSGTWEGRWPDLPICLNWDVREDGGGITWSVSVHIERPLGCERLETVLPLIPCYHAWRTECVKDRFEIIDPGIFGERYNLDFLDLRTSGFFPQEAIDDRRYHFLTASPRPILQAGSFLPEWPLIRIEALTDVNLGAVTSVPEDGGARELRLLAWPRREGSREIPPGEYRIAAHITIGRRPRRWVEEILQEHLDAVGAATGKVLQGPLEVQISPTNRCNQSCIACWCHAPFQRDTGCYPAWASQQMDLRFFEKLVDEVALGGTPVVSLIGQGDPLLHKDILEMIRMVKGRGMRCRLNTNGLLLNHELNRKLVEIGLDRLHVSLWAARRETYARLHPGSDGSELKRIEEALQDLTRAKEQAHSPLPYLELFHAICKENINEIEQLIEQAERLGANSIYLRPVCAIPGRTEYLLPTKAELEKLHSRLVDARSRIETTSHIIINFNEYMQQTSSPRAAEGRYSGHPPNKPCYLGWGYAMVHTNGAMSPCCLGGPLAALMESPYEFLPIWISETFQEFRAKGLDMKKNVDYFTKRFPCLTECCMDAVNDVVREKVEAISFASREFPLFRRAVNKIARKAERKFLNLVRQCEKLRRSRSIRT